MKKNTKFLLKLAITIAFIWLILVKVGVQETIDQLKNINPEWIALLLVFEVLTLLLSAINIFILVKKIKKDIPFLRVCKYFLRVWSINLFAPGKIGDFSLLYFLKKEDIKIGESTAIVIMNNIITLGVVFLFALFGVYTFFGIGNVVVFTIGGIIVLVIAGILLLAKKVRAKIVSSILREKGTYFKGFGKWIQYMIKKEKGVLAANILITIINMFCIYMVYYIGFRMIGVVVSYSAIMAVVPLARLAALIPITLNGLGIKEGVSIYLFGLLGVRGSIVLSASLILTAITYLTGALATVITSLIDTTKKN